MQAVQDAVRRMPGEQRHDDEQKPLAERVLRQRQHARVAQQVGRQQPAQRYRQAGDEHQGGAQQRAQHAAGAEQEPEDRGVGAFHDPHHAASPTSATDASAEAR